ncbi:MAG: hypothetical protein AAGD05_05355 [Bacteroidota bacterium]
MSQQKKNITRSLRALRQLPLEISFEQVEQWLQQQTTFELESPSWWMRLWLKWGRSKEDKN